MQTKNKYFKPVDKADIKKILFNSPSHRKYFNRGKNTHYDLINAVDFLCDKGTDVKAALDGIIFRIENGFTKTWKKLKIPPKEKMTIKEQDGNFVIIKHENDEFSIYSHLKTDSIKIEVGDSIKQGEVIAKSGDTGWSIKPHLHFMVFKLGKNKLKSLKIQWKNKSV